MPRRSAIFALRSPRSIPGSLHAGVRGVIEDAFVPDSTRLRFGQKGPELKPRTAVFFQAILAHGWQIGISGGEMAIVSSVPAKRSLGIAVPELGIAC